MKYSGRWAFLTFLLGCASAAAQPSCSSSVTGTAVPALAALDTAIQAPLSKYNIPGASLAVSYKGRLVFARGYGCGNKSSNTPVQPDSTLTLSFYGPRGVTGPAPAGI